jgi:serine-type D-Ala-D-Ala endopeptidase (penicillin-binding protein 7)
MNGLRKASLAKKFATFVCLMGLLSASAWLPVAQAASETKQSLKVKKRPVVVKSRVVRSFERSSQKSAAVRSRSRPGRVTVAPTPSYGHLAGLQNVQDALSLKSNVALVVDQETNEVLFKKNEGAVLPIASLTKLMTGLVLTEANLPLDEIVTITQDDVDTEKGSTSRLRVGSQLSRGDLLHLALMSSENRAAHALGRTYPAGMPAFVRLMNAKAQALGMKDTRYVEPTGLSSANQSSAQDLVKLVDAAHQQPLLRELSTSTGYQVAVGKRLLQFNTTNRLVKNPSWDIGLQKTGYISEAGRCLVMQTTVAGRQLIMVFLDSVGKLTRIADAERVRHWLEASPGAKLSATSIESDSATNPVSVMVAQYF